MTFRRSNSISLALLSLLFCATFLISSVESFTPSSPKSSLISSSNRIESSSIRQHISTRLSSFENDHVEDVGISRRSLLCNAPFLPLGLMLATTTNLASPANAATPSNNTGGMEKVTKMTPEEAEIKLKEGYKTIVYLLDNYEQVCEGGGDNVRRYLGTIVTNPPSPLVGISKTLKALEDRADDFIEYNEMSEEVIKTINQADGSAYMSIFVTTSTSYTPPKKYFNDALIEVKRCKKALEEIASMVGVSLS